MSQFQNASSAEVRKNSEIDSTVHRLNCIRDQLKDRVDALSGILKPVLGPSPPVGIGPEKERPSPSGSCSLHGDLLRIEALFDDVKSELSSLLERIQL